MYFLEMSSSSNQQSSSSTKQSPFRANNTATDGVNPRASTPTTSSAQRSTNQVAETKQQDVDTTKLGDNEQPLSVDKTVPVGGSAAAAAAEDDAENPSQPAHNFKSFFTLIEDANSPDYHHPTVHYIFLDDDTEIITEASLRVLESGPPPPSTLPHEDASTEPGNRESASLERPLLLPPPIPGVKERFILLDVDQAATNTTTTGPLSAPDALASTSAGTGTTTIVSTSPAQKQTTANTTSPYGYRIVSAHSLTPDWQVLNASLSLAPTFDMLQQQNSSDQVGVDNTLMLRIEGTGGYPRDIPVGGKDKEATTAVGAGAGATAAKEPTLEEMMEQFDKRMSELRQIIESSGDYAPMATTTTTAVQPGFDEKEDNEKDNEGEIQETAAPEPESEQAP